MFQQAVRTRNEVLSEMREHERTVSAARAEQISLLRELLRQNHLPDQSELAAALDVSIRTAKDLLEAALRTPERHERMHHLETGEWSFDRAAATAALVTAGAGDSTFEEAERRDIAGVRRLRADLNRINRRTEREAHENRSLRAWASLDTAAGFLQAQLTGTDWQLVTAALDSRGDHLPRDLASTATQRRADALVALAHDWLDGRVAESVTAGNSAVVTIVVDPAIAGPTGGEGGATILGGPRVGPMTLDEIMCGGAVEIVVSATTGVPLAVGPTTQVVPPKVRRAVIARDGGCVVDGCDSRYRLQVHHIVPRSQGGTHDAGNLATLCWYHHHVMVHGRGMTLDADSPPNRRRLIPAGRDP